MRCVIFTLCLLLAASPAFACLESYTSVPLVVTGKVAPGKTFRKEISPGFYFADGTWPEKLVKVRKTPAPPIYLWVIPEGKGWLLSIGPKVGMNYIAVTTSPVVPRPLIFSADTAFKGAEFCFTMEPEDYAAAINAIRDSASAVESVRGSQIIEALSAQCRKKDADIGHGSLTVNSLPGGEVEFKADLNIPVYTTDCPAPDVGVRVLPRND